VKNEFLLRFAARLKRRREALGLSLSEAAGVAGISKTHWWQLERGQSEPGAVVLVSLADTLRVNLDWLVRGACAPANSISDEH
jgi:transcriptional regulator with XRE-family HTH domain